jgi:hypothetical protein
VWFSVSNGLQPLNRLRADLNARGGDDLAPLAADQVPYELEPVVSAFNGLLAKVGEARRRGRISWPTWRTSCARRWLASRPSWNGWQRAMPSRTPPNR